MVLVTDGDRREDDWSLNHFHVHLQTSNVQLSGFKAWLVYTQLVVLNNWHMLCIERA